MMKKVFALILAAALCLSFGACNSQTDSIGNGGTPDAGRASEVVVGIAADPGTLDPFVASNTGNIATYQTVYEHLLYINGMGGEPQPSIAKSYELESESNGQWVWAFEINEGVKDADGNTYTANDVKWYVDTIKPLGVDANMEYIDEIEVVDDTHFKMHLNASQIGLVELLASSIKGVVRETYEKYGNEFAKNPVTTAHYQVSKYTTGSEIVAEKRDDYWGENVNKALQAKANVDKITFKIITDATQMDIALQNNEVDMIPSVASADLFDFLNEDDLSVKDGFFADDYLRGATLIMFFNNSENNAFANEDLRKACAYAVDTGAIVQNVLGGQGTALCTVGSECFGDFQMDWYDDEYYGRNGVNLDKAKELLTSSGFDTSQEIRIITETDNTIVRVAQIVDSYLRELGLNPKIESYEAALYEEMCADPDAWDIFIGYRGAGDYLANMWRWTFDQEIRDGFTANFVHDEELQGYLKACLDPNSHTPEDMTKFKNLLNDKCYAYGIFAQKMYVLGSKKVTEFVFAENWSIVPGACSYNF